MIEKICYSIHCCNLEEYRNNTEVSVHIIYKILQKNRKRIEKSEEKTFKSIYKQK